ncbi:MAG: EF-P 5-aminopentanol modification-associated protein YfmH [Oscillospiraceae bacterium]
MRETTVELIRNDYTGISYKLVRHSSGLDILLAPMNDFVQTAAMFGTKYGSINNCFKTSEDNGFVKVPDGIAHYLEHKLFENEDSDVFELYAQTGAEGNAYTGFEKTVYLFTCTENYLESLRILLEFVQRPFFTKENVDKEQGIIAQEINMTQDLPKRKCFMNLINAMYSEHPVRNDIAGTVESIAEITPELLYKCYNAFYDLHNMALAVAGNLDENEVIALCDECLKPCEDKCLELSFPNEPLQVAKKSVEENFKVGLPIFFIGFKCPPVSEEDIIKNEVEADFLLSLFADKTSRLYKELTEENIISGGLSCEILDGNGYFSLIISGEANDPYEVQRRIFKHIEIAKQEGFDREAFELLKKSEYGIAVRAANNPECVADDMLSYHLIGHSAFECEKRIAQLKYEDIIAAANRLLDPENCSISIIR